MPTHVLYLDDSGTKEYADDPQDYVTTLARKGNTRYFLFGGLLTTTAEAGHLTSAIVNLKLCTFGTDDVEVKSNWLRLPKERERRYLQPFKMSDDDLDKFVEDYYTIIEAANIEFLAAVVDKLHMQQKYPNPWYAPAVSYEGLLQRVENALAAGQTVSVIIDDMSGATPAGNQYKDNLCRHHTLLKRRGSSLMRGFAFPSLTGDPKFVNSAHSHLVQVADVAAYNVYRQFVEYGQQWEDGTIGTLPTYPYLDRIAKKFRKDENGRVQGYGIVKFPVLRKVRWCAK